VQDTLSSYRTIHILVNNTGTTSQASAHNNVNVKSFHRTREIAALGTIIFINIVYPTLEKQGYKRIINTSSNSLISIRAKGDGSYMSSKGSTFSLTRDLGCISPKHGIKINGILPLVV
jgi:NAD(P)-dependent dehydrogenase (short-subunit alcohol dehydrogenase family)